MPGSRARDFGAHAVEEVGKIDDLRFTGSGFDDGRSLGKNGSHHEVVRSENGGAVLSAKVYVPSLEAALSLNDHIAAFGVDLGPNGFEAL